MECLLKIKRCEKIYKKEVRQKLKKIYNYGNKKTFW